MPMKAKACVLALVLTFMLCEAYAGTPAISEYNATDEADYMEKVEFEKQLEERLGKDVSSYLGHDRFIIKIDSVLTKTRTVLRKPYLVPDEETPADAGEGMENEAQQDEQMLVEEARPPRPLMLLPGMPMTEVPQTKATASLKKTIAKTQSGGAGKPSFDFKDEVIGFATNVKSLAISIVLDKTTSAEQEEFVRNLIFGKAHLDAVRGDTLQITKADFPLMQKHPAQFNYNNYILPVSALLISALLIAFIIAMRGRRAPTRMPLVAAPMPMAPSAAPDNEAKGIDQSQIIQKLRQDIATVSVGRPELANTVLKDIIGVAGIEGAAKIFQGLGFQLASGIFKSLSEQELISIRKSMTGSKDTDMGEVAQAMQDFYDKTILGGLSSASKTVVKPFDFLDALDESQISYLINEEEMRVKALVLSQISPEMAARVVGTFPDEQQGQIASAIGGFSSIPISAFRDVADRLSRKSIGLPSFRNITADGIGLLVEIFDRLGGASEKMLLDALKTQNPATYHKLMSVYLTFDGLARLPKNVLKDALRELDRKTIALSVIKEEGQLRDLLIESLPDRLKIMVKDELETIGSAYAPADIETAKRAVLLSARVQVKKQGVSLEGLIV